MSSRALNNGQGNTEVAEAIRDACVQAALNAYENARMDGLCHEGAWEVAVGAMQTLNVARVLEKVAEQPRQQS